MRYKSIGEIPNPDGKHVVANMVTHRALGLDVTHSLAILACVRVMKRRGTEQFSANEAFVEFETIVSEVRTAAVWIEAFYQAQKQLYDDPWYQQTRQQVLALSIGVAGIIWQAAFTSLTDAVVFVEQESDLFVPDPEGISKHIQLAFEDVL